MTRFLLFILATAFLVGCTPATKQADTAQKKEPAKEAKEPAKELLDAEAIAAIAAERAKFSPEDRALIDAQEWCVISTEERLGGMSGLKKIMVKDQPVFLCCGGCAKAALRDPEKTLATLEKLKLAKIEELKSNTKKKE